MKKFIPPTESECRRAIERLKEMEAERTQTKPCCDNCRFGEWHKGELLCHRYPPPMTQERLLYWAPPHFPQVGMLKPKLQWCGEFEAKK
jgi:hypothetical protein